MHVLSEIRLDNSQKKRKPGRPKLLEEKKCSRCFTSSSPGWRRGPDERYLCNACGLQYRKLFTIVDDFKGDIRITYLTSPMPIIERAFVHKIGQTLEDYKQLMDSIYNLQIKYGEYYSLYLNEYTLYVEKDGFNFVRNHNSTNNNNDNNNNNSNNNNNNQNHNHNNYYYYHHQ